MQSLRLLLLITVVAACSTSPKSPSTGDATRFDISGAYIGQSYSELRKLLPLMVCEVTCWLRPAQLAGHPGNLLVGIGDSNVNQIGFGFVPKLTQSEGEALVQEFSRLHGTSSIGMDRCNIWDKVGGQIVLCVSGGLSIAYWKDSNWGRTKSVIPQ